MEKASLCLRGKRMLAHECHVYECQGGAPGCCRSREQPWRRAVVAASPLPWCQLQLRSRRGPRVRASPASGSTPRTGTLLTQGHCSLESLIFRAPSCSVAAAAYQGVDHRGTLGSVCASGGAAVRWSEGLQSAGNQILFHVASPLPHPLAVL